MTGPTRRFGQMALGALALAGTLAPAAAHGQSVIDQNKAIARRWSEELWSRATSRSQTKSLRRITSATIPAIRSRRGAGGRQAHRADAALDAAGLPHRSGSDHRRRRFRGQPLHRDGHRHRRIHGDARHRQGDPHTGDPDLPLLERQDRRELGGPRRSRHIEAARPLPPTEIEADSLR